MFCDEVIEGVFECMPEYPDGVNYYFDFTRNMTMHLTKGYRIILKTKTFFLCIGYDGVNVEHNIDDVVR
ncbi:MAG: hypothetical protein J6V58_03265, partial [Clostridia bacterium]|nr:hypothetical protein [Clostridia bacterium]